MNGTRLVLASTSPYRRELLARLRLPFDVANPDTDETPLPDEQPEDLAQRLATAKAVAVSRMDPQAWVIGSDQVAVLDDRILGKPGSRAAALSQLHAMSGRALRFVTALSLVHGDGRQLAATDITEVRFRPLVEAEITRYVDAEQPFDCAGSFKAEGLGIVLFEAIESQDPTALVGLPLIATARLLRQVGFPLP